MGDRTIKLAVVGVGNCASSLIQGIEYYKDAADDAFIPGLMHANFGGYHVRDIEVVAAFDVHSGKVGRDVAEAIYAEPNNTTVFAQVPTTGVLTAAPPASSGSRGDWANEIHPNKSGWKKLAKVWAQELATRLP